MNNVNIKAKTSYHHGNLKPALVAAALKEISREGPEGFSLRGVARRAGVSAPAVYRHFKDKDDLLAAVAIECAERLGAVMVEAVSSAPADPLERFRATGIALVRFAVANPEHFRALSVPGLFERTPRDQLERQLAFQQAEMAKLADAQAAGHLTALPLDDIMLAANSIVLGLAHLMIEGKLGPIDDARATQLAVAVTGVLGLGLIPRDEDVHDARRSVTVKGKRKR